MKKKAEEEEKDKEKKKKEETKEGEKKIEGSGGLVPKWVKWVFGSAMFVGSSLGLFWLIRNRNKFLK